MQRVLNVSQMIEADKFTIEKLGVDEKILIERAGRACADEIKKRFFGGRVLVVVGKGNNGKDGEVIARELAKTHGFAVDVFHVENDGFEIFDKKHDIIIDCIFGTGLNREVVGREKTAIEKINKSGLYVIACDIASGINGDTGVVCGVAVKAKLTIAIQELKHGHFLHDGIDYSGEVVVKDIGISVWTDDYAVKLDIDDIKSSFPTRKRNSHKGNYGKCAVVGGSNQYVGSLYLAQNSASAFSCGVGYVYTYAPKSLFGIYAGKNPECILRSFADDNGNILFDEKALETMLNMSSIAIGMGIGVSFDTYKSIEYLLKNYEGKLIIDADGLNSISKYGIDVLKNAKCTVALTPHVGEFCSMCGIKKDELISKPVAIARKFAREYRVTLVLKSAVSIITNGVNTYVNSTGNSALAKAGSGDVLSGIIAGISARTIDLTEACAHACYLFGIAGENASQEFGEYGTCASDVVYALKKVVKSIED